MSLPTILIIDDEASIRRLLRLTLQAVPYRVVEGFNGREGLHLVAAERPSLIVLDMGLPDMNGRDVLKELRTWTTTPVVILSVEKDPQTIVEALDMGADDYVTKPFRTDEFLARVRVCLRRTLEDIAKDRLVKIDDIEVDLDRRVVKKGRDVVHLTSLEYDFLCFLIMHRGKIVTHGQILKAVWGPNAPSDSSNPRVYVRHLRQKLETKPDEPKILLTETGMGYRLIE